MRHRPTDRSASGLLRRSIPLLRTTRPLRRPSSAPPRLPSNARWFWSGFRRRRPFRRWRVASMLSGSSGRRRSTRSRRPPGSARSRPVSLASTTMGSATIRCAVHALHHSKKSPCCRDPCHVANAVLPRHFVVCAMYTSCKLASCISSAFPQSKFGMLLRLSAEALTLPLLERPPSLPWLGLARGALPRPTPRRLAPDRRGGDALPPYERLPRSASCTLASPPAAAHARRQGRPAQPPSLPGSPRSRRSAIRSWPASTTQAACLPTQASAGRRGHTSSHRHRKRVEMPAALASGSAPLPSLPRPRPSAPRLILGSAPRRF